MVEEEPAGSPPPIVLRALAVSWTLPCGMRNVRERDTSAPLSRCYHRRDRGPGCNPGSASCRRFPRLWAIDQIIIGRRPRVPTQLFPFKSSVRTISCRSWSLQKPSPLLLSRMPSWTRLWPRSVRLRYCMPNTLVALARTLPREAMREAQETLGCSGGQVCRHCGASKERPAHRADEMPLLPPEGVPAYRSFERYVPLS
jgi:hypothetical protein